MKECLLKRLEKWCEDNSTTYSRLYVKRYENGHVSVKRCNGSSQSTTIHYFRNLQELDDFCKGIDELETDYIEEMNKVIEKMSN